MGSTQLRILQQVGVAVSFFRKMEYYRDRKSFQAGMEEIPDPGQATHWIS